MNTKIMVIFWDLISCSLIDRYQCFEEPAALILYQEREAAYPSTTLAPLH